MLNKVENDAMSFNFKFTNNLIRFESNNNFTGENYNLDNTAHYEGTIFNESPDFKDPNKNELIIGDDSAANGKGLATFANQVTTDILNVNRTTSSDLGAYQHVVFEE